jgi:hypothetical protein
MMGTRRKAVLAGLASLAILGLGAGIGIASTSTINPVDAVGVIHSCFDSTTGRLRAAAPGLSCATGETRLVWNQQGVQGVQGVKGDKGDTGAQGLKGDKGDTGAQGLKGDTGATGPQGVKGDTGATGATGATGPQGEKGDNGDIGATGAAGPAGATGPQGATGATGPAGPAGATGPQGATGPAGSNGAFGWVRVAADGTVLASSPTGVNGVTKILTGGYRVHFNRADSENCAAVATIDGFGADEITATAQDQLGGDVLVETWKGGRDIFGNTSTEDRGFGVVLYC